LWGYIPIYPRRYGPDKHLARVQLKRPKSGFNNNNNNNNTNNNIDNF